MSNNLPRWLKLKRIYFIRVSSVLSMKILIRDTILTSPTGDRTAILRGYPSKPREGLAICNAKGVPSFLSYFTTLSIGLVSGIEPATSGSAVKRSTN